MMKNKSKYVERGESYPNEQQKSRDTRKLKTLATKLGYGIIALPEVAPEKMAVAT